MIQQQKKQIYIGPTIQHIQNSQFLIKNNDHLLLLHKRQLNLLDLQSESITASKIDSEKVYSCTVHQILNVYLIKTLDSIFIVNQSGESLGKVNLKEETSLIESRFIFILPMQDGPRQDPHQRIDKLLYITDQNIHISNIKVTFERAIMKNKRITEFSFQVMKKEGKNTQIDPSIIFDAPEWIQRCKIFNNLGYFVCYNKLQMMVFKLPKLIEQTIQPYLTYRKTSKTDNKITDVTISYRQKQIIFGHESGVIKIYRFNQSKKYLQELRGHQNQCQSLFISDKNDKDILYSCGLDNTVRIWNLHHFEEIYSLRIDLICDSIFLLSDELAFIKFSNFRKTCLCKINAYKMQPIMTQNKGGKITSLKCDGQWGIILYSNNYAQMFLVNQEQSSDADDDPFDEPNVKKLKSYIQKIQFPLKYGNVVSAKKLRHNQYALILEKGFSMITLNKDQIVSENFQLKKLVYNQQISHVYSDSEPEQQDIDQIYNVHEPQQKISRIKQLDNQTKCVIQTPNQNKRDSRLVELIHQKLLGTYLFSILQDWKGIPTAINVTFVTFVVGKGVPMWDMDQKKKVVNKAQIIPQKKRRKSIIPVQQQKLLEDSIHVVLGTDKGVVYFVDIQNRVQFQSRIVMHTRRIQYIKQFFPKKMKGISSSMESSQLFFLSTDQSRQICLWSLLQQRAPNIYCRVPNHRDITHLSVHNSFLLIGQKQGKISILQFMYDEQKIEGGNISSMLLSPVISKKDSKGPVNAKIYFKETKNQSSYGHMKKVDAGDYINYKQKDLFITGSEDCTIKLWLGLDKILLFQLKIFDPVEHIRFIYRGLDFMMSHNDQISIIKRKNIVQIMRIDNDLDKKYSSITYFGFQTLSIRSFFLKQKEFQIIASNTKKSNFRLKMKNSLKNDSSNIPLGQLLPISKTTRQKFYFNINPINELSLIPQQAQKSNVQADSLSRLQQAKKQDKKYHSPEKQMIQSQQKQRNIKVYAKSEQKLKAKKSFHIANTAESKQYNQVCFLLPKIVGKNQANNYKRVNNHKRVSPSTSFRTSTFMDQIKSQRQRAFSYVGRSGK